MRAGKRLTRAILMIGLLSLAPRAASDEPTGVFKIVVVDEQTGRGVPLVELRTMAQHRYVTDSAGAAAIRDPELFGQTAFFYVGSHGYEFAKDGFGFQGKSVSVVPGGSAQFMIKRINMAERLYRVTGAGIYADTVLAGGRAPIAHPLLNAQVTGSDSVVTALYHGRIYWFWGDTNRPKYPLGLFHVPGATSRPPSDGGLDPDKGVDLEYFVNDDGFAKAMCKMPGEGPTWINGLTVLRDADGRERLFCGYVKVRGMLEIHERGIAEFDDAKNAFRQVKSFAKDVPLFPGGHPVRHSVDGVDYVYFGEATATARVRATVESFLDLSRYEGFTCLVAGSRADAPRVERDDAGRVVWGWKQDTPPIDRGLEEKLTQSGQLKADEARLRTVDADSGKPVLVHNGSITWNEHRGRWISIFTQSFGSSMLGEIWYAESDAPEGPLPKAVKILTHDKYSFYNPKQHPYFSAGRHVYFEGTYTHTFSGGTEQTSRYDYNQIMYRLDVDDPRLKGLQ
ncbi:MAG: hypothetical protein FJ297_15160 [Planctomycetes bacterium]|nr:hypothetical protein [Planctomycetota bacterium]